MPFEPFKPGNQMAKGYTRSGKPNSKTLLSRLLQEKHPKHPDKTVWEVLWEKQIARAEKSSKGFAMLLDRLEGKPASNVKVSVQHKSLRELDTSQLLLNSGVEVVEGEVTDEASEDRPNAEESRAVVEAYHPRAQEMPLSKESPQTENETADIGQSPDYPSTLDSENDK